MLVINKMEVFTMAKKYKCPYCDERYIRKDLINHIDDEHEDVIPDGFESAQIVYDLVNNTKGAGKCRICGRPTKWNSNAKRYDVLCLDPRCKQKMREEYQKNMLRVHGTYNILTSDEQQKKMLANRSISGKYKFTDGGVVTYTGSYEKKFLEFADRVMQIPSKDIMAPGPTIEYEMNGEKHFYITDFLYIPYNLIIEVKDGGSNPNNKNTVGMQSSRQRTIEKEKLITDRGEYHYLRLTDNQFVQLLEIFMDIKKALIEGFDGKVVRINESKSTIDKNYEPKGKKNLSSFKKVHITETVIDKYKKEYPFLKHVRCKDTKEYICDGYIWFDNDELAAMVGSCEYTDDKTKWIVSLEVTKNYKGYGLSKQILDYAVKSMNCKYLSVNKNNEIAKKVYDDYGFKVYQESDTMYYMTINKNIKEATNVFTSGDFAEYREIGEIRLKELQDKDNFYNDILKIESKNSTHNYCDKLMPLAIASMVIENYVNEEPISETEVITEKYFKPTNNKKVIPVPFDDFKAYHIEPKIAAKNKDPKYYSWDEEQYAKSIEDAINNSSDTYETRRYNSFDAYVYTAGKNLKPVYLGTIHIRNKNNPSDWEWIEQEFLKDNVYKYLKHHPMVEAFDISNFYDDEEF